MTTRPAPLEEFYEEELLDRLELVECGLSEFGVQVNHSKIKDINLSVLTFEADLALLSKLEASDAHDLAKSMCFMLGDDWYLNRYQKYDGSLSTAPKAPKPVANKDYDYRESKQVDLVYLNRDRQHLESELSRLSGELVSLKTETEKFSCRTQTLDPKYCEVVDVMFKILNRITRKNRLKYDDIETILLLFKEGAMGELVLFDAQTLRLIMQVLSPYTDLNLNQLDVYEGFLPIVETEEFVRSSSYELRYNGLLASVYSPPDYERYEYSLEMPINTPIEEDHRFRVLELLALGEERLEYHLPVFMVIALKKFYQNKFG